MIVIRKCSSPFLVKLGSIEPREIDVEGVIFYVYSEEFLLGESLRGKIQSDHKPELAELIELTVCGLNAINEIKNVGIIHRDIKPDNIMATGLPERPYVIIDFGVAFLQGGTPLTGDSARIPGTLYYIAPEMLVINYRENLDYRADLYALALTVYEYATGKNPFWKTEEFLLETALRIQKVLPSQLRSLRNDLPETFCSMIDQLMKKIPALRPANIPSLIKKVEGLK